MIRVAPQKYWRRHIGFACSLGVTVVLAAFCLCWVLAVGLMFVPLGFLFYV